MANNASATLSPRTMWGKVILYLKEKHLTSLQIACGDIIDVGILGNNFVINTNEAFTYDILINEDNKKLLQEALKWQGFSGNIVINRIIKPEELVEEDLTKLKILGITFEVIEGEKNE